MFSWAATDHVNGLSGRDFRKYVTINEAVLPSMCLEHRQDSRSWRYASN
jgi:hypothetical protein